MSVLLLVEVAVALEHVSLASHNVPVEQVDFARSKQVAAVRRCSILVSQCIVLETLLGLKELLRKT